ncbi:lectin [Sarcoptes scabiei]|nr:lectin [Sarcoptes scabiei]
MNKSLNESSFLGIDKNFRCNILKVATNSSASIRIDEGWETIPESLILDSFVALILISIYKSVPFVLRLFNLNFSWLKFFSGDLFQVKLSQFSFDSIERNKIEEYLKRNIKNENVISLLPEHFGRLAKCFASHIFNEKSSIEDRSETFKALEIEEPDYRNKSSVQANKMRKFLHKLFTLNIDDEEIIKTKGIDVYQYLLFQKYLIIFLSLLTIITNGIVMPINIFSNINCDGFACTSMSNLPHNTWYCWVHANCAIIAIITMVYIMNKFTRELNFIEDVESNTAKRILLVRFREPISKQSQSGEENSTEFLRKSFERRFIGSKVIGIQIVFDTQNLERLRTDFNNSYRALEYSKKIFDQNNQRLMIRPHIASELCPCLPHRIDSINFYTDEIERLRKSIEIELSQMTSKPIRTIFIELETEQMAKRIHNDCSNDVREKSIEDSLEWIESDVDHAPQPDDVNWDNLLADIDKAWIIKILCSIILFVIFFFLSTPAYVFKLLDMIAIKPLNDQGIIRKDSILMGYLNPLLIATLASMMPMIVAKVLQRIPYRTISEFNHAVMINIFVFMVLTIIILPSAGFLTMNAMLNDIIGEESAQNGHSKFRWQCLFPVDNGAFFVVYILHMAILGNLIEYLRLIDLVLYFVSYFGLRSKAEFWTARKAIIQEFPMGIFYSQFLLIFTMTIIFSFASPIIVPFGLLYVLCKHLVDRYNIYHVYEPSKINRNVHTTAIMFVYIGLLLMSLQLFSVIMIKNGYTTVSKYLLIIIIVTVLLSLIQFFCLRLIRQKNIALAQMKIGCVSLNRCICFYIPPSFRNLIDNKFFDV